MSLPIPPMSSSLLLPPTILSSPEFPSNLAPFESEIKKSFFDVPITHSMLLICPTKFSFDRPSPIFDPDINSAKVELSIMSELIFSDSPGWAGARAFVCTL